jgi:hypothetical protein
MFDLFIIALLQFATMTGNAPTSTIGSSGWENDVAPKSNTIGSSGWENDAVSGSSKIGSSGWENDEARQ